MKRIIYSLSELASFQNWKERLHSNLLRLSSQRAAHRQTICQLMTCLHSGDSSVSILFGQGSIVTYLWPTGEPKHLALFGECVEGEDPFWLCRYPFLEYNSSKSKYVLRDSTCSTTTIDAPREVILSIISHNSHFGHFIADDLPRLAAASNYLQSTSLVVPASSAPSFAAKELNLLKSISLAQQIKTSKDSLSQITGTVLHSYITDWAVRAFIVRKVVHSTRKFNAGHQNMQFNDGYQGGQLRYFIRRNHRYQSRVHNILEVESFLESKGFVTVSIDHLTLCETKELLGSCGLAVAECGSTTLTSAICLSKDAHLISMQPEQMLANPTCEMRISGLPYALFFHPNITIVTGEEVSLKAVQSSSVCNYRIKELKDLIDYLG